MPIGHHLLQARHRLMTLDRHQPSSQSKLAAWQVEAFPAPGVHRLGAVARAAQSDALPSPIRFPHEAGAGARPLLTGAGESPSASSAGIATDHGEPAVGDDEKISRAPRPRPARGMRARLDRLLHRRGVCSVELERLDAVGITVDVRIFSISKSRAPWLISSRSGGFVHRF
jgi:hypothetical protein